MKSLFTVARVALVSLVLLGAAASNARANNKPIPGVDIIVEKNPGGTKFQTTTDKDGAFAFTNLAAGQYKVSVARPQTKAAISTSRSNIKRPSVRMDGAANTVTVGFAVLPGDTVGTEVTVASAGGKITGTVVRDEPTLEKADVKKESGAKR